LTESNQVPSNLKIWEGSSASVEQGRHWSSALIWITSTLFGATLIWAFTAKLDQTVTVRGRLEPSGSVREVDSPSAGVVSKVFIEDGQVVKEGQDLFTVEAKGLASRRFAIMNTLALMDLQARSLQGILKSGGNPQLLPPLPAIPLSKDPVLSSQLISARQQTQQIRSQLEQLATRLASRRETLHLQQQIANDLKPLYTSGGMARNQYLTQLNQLQESRAEVLNLQEERTRLISQVAAQLNDINRQTINLRAELVGLKETISYRTIKAPIAGRIFDAKISPYSVVNSDQTVLKIVPSNRLQANIDITNSDIGFVKVGMPATVSIDSFPSGEFGYIRGTLTSIGSDALPPTQLTPQYRFPATVTLKEQEVDSGAQRLNLQSGMGVSANIKLRSRPMISVITDMFTKQFEGVKRFR